MYQEIYDIRNDIFSLLPSILFLFIFFGIRVAIKRHYKNAKLGLVTTVFVVITTTLFIYQAWEYIILSELVKENRCSIVEGVVYNFNPKSFWGKRPESFYVDSVYFEYNDGNLGNGYNKIQGLGGKIREGQYVRICYQDGVILKLEFK